MSKKNNLNAIFQYLKKITIAIDEAEFEYQFLSHPDYPSLLALSDTLHFFKINNKAFKITNKQIEELPANFIALLKNEEDINQFSFIKKANLTLEVDNKRETLEYFTKKFQNIVLLAEKEDNFKESKSKNYFLNHTLLTISVAILFFSICIYFLPFGENLLIFCLFSVTTLLGLFFSIETFRQILGLKDGIASRFCNLNSETNCKSVLTSKKWKIFEKVSLSDISIVFFASQTVLLIIFSLLNQFSAFLYLTSLYLIPVIPISFLSIYYQWKIEKSWCPLCLAIILILYLEIVLSYSNLFYNNISITSVFNKYIKEWYNESLIELYLLSISFSLFIMAFWMMIKPILTKNKELKKQNIINLRFRKDYNLFKSQLLKSEKIEFPISEMSIILGDKDAVTTIQIITSPFCKYCKEAHAIIHSIYLKHRENFKIHIIFNISKNDKNLNLYRSLYSIYLEKGGYDFQKKMEILFDDKKYMGNIIKSYIPSKNEIGIDNILQVQNEFCNKHDFNFTPNIFINGYQYPKIYERQELEFFISEIIEDEEILNENV